MKICLILIFAFILDLLLGDPMWLCNLISHPAIIIGKIISKSEKFIRPKLPKTKKFERIGGFLTVIITLVLSTVPVFIILKFLYKINVYLGFIIETFICYRILAIKSLKDESMKVYYALKNGTLDDGRKMVGYIVGRDTTALSKEGVIKAAVETVAENTVDGVVSPLIYMSIFGAVGGIFYKAVNTLDSMIGYKNDKYIYFGTAGAKLDDFMNFLPSRITAVIMIFSSLLCRLDYKNAYKIWHRDRRNHKSPNSAQCESVAAGALDVQLAGNAYYFGKLYEKPYIGDKIREIETEDIKVMNKLMYCTSFISLLITVLIRFSVIILIFK